MTQDDIRSLIIGFVAALQLNTSPERAKAIHALVDKGFRLGVAIDQPSSGTKPVDITLAALDLLGQMALTANQNRNRNMV